MLERIANMPQFFKLHHELIRQGKKHNKEQTSVPLFCKAKARVGELIRATWRRLEHVR